MNATVPNATVGVEYDEETGVLRLEIEHAESTDEIAISVKYGHAGTKRMIRNLQDEYGDES